MNESNKAEHNEINQPKALESNEPQASNPGEKGDLNSGGKNKKVNSDSEDFFLLDDDLEINELDLELKELEEMVAPLALSSYLINLNLTSL